MKRTLLFLILILFLFSTNYAQVNTESFRADSIKPGLSIISDIELSLMAGNTDFQHFGSNTRINNRWAENDYTFLILNGGFGRNEGETFFSQALIHLRNVNVLHKNLQLEEFVQYDNNKNLLLLDRYIAGAGLRFHIFNNKKVTWRVGTSLFAEYEEYDLPSAAKHDIENQTIRFSSYLTFNLKLKEDIDLLSVTYLQPDIQDLADFRILSNNALQVKFSKNVSLNIKIDGRYDSRSADGIKEFDLISNIGLAIAFE